MEWNEHVSDFIEAARSGDVEALQRMHKRHRVNVNSAERDFPKASAIHISCGEGHLECVRYLVEQGANVSAVDRELWTPLHCAADGGHLEVVEFLLADTTFDEPHPDIGSLTNEKESPLHRSSLGGHVDVCELLIQKGSNILLLNSDEKTPLAFAAENPDLPKDILFQLREVFSRRERLEHERGTMSLDDYVALREFKSQSSARESDLSSKVADLQQELEALRLNQQSELDTVKKQYGSPGVEIQRLNLELDKIRGERSRLQSRLETSEGRRTEAERLLTESEEEAAGASQETSELKERVTELEAKIQSLETESSDLKSLHDTELEELKEMQERQLREIRTSSDRKERDLAAENSEITRKVSILEKERETQLAELRDQQAEMVRLRTEVKTLQGEVERQQQQIAMLKRPKKNPITAVPTMTVQAMPTMSIPRRRRRPQPAPPPKGEIAPSSSSSSSPSSPESLSSGTEPSASGDADAEELVRRKEEEYNIKLRALIQQHQQELAEKDAQLVASMRLKRNLRRKDQEIQQLKAKIARLEGGGGESADGPAPPPSPKQRRGRFG